MAVYVYKPGNANALRAERLGLFGINEGDAESERHRLVNAGMNATLKREAVTREVTELLARSRNDKLPVEFVSRLMVKGFYEAPVAEDPSGLGMRAVADEGRSRFTVDTEKATGVDELVAVAGGRQADPDTFNSNFMRQVITHSAVQYQLYLDSEGFRFREHSSFGFMGANSYEPFVTVLNEEHPVTQAVRQLQADQEPPQAA
jgi:hypothetical protein